MSTVIEIRTQLKEIAGPGRRAEVETFGGWRAVEEWRPYGTVEPKSVEFRWDAERGAVREEMTEYGRRFHERIANDNAILGIWPIRFVEVQQ